MFLCGNATLAGRMLTYRRDLRQHAAVYVVSMETRTRRQNINEYLEKWPVPEPAFARFGHSGERLEDHVFCPEVLHMPMQREIFPA